jgi:uncharacterized protein YndB with AHSA1/START domain
MSKQTIIKKDEAKKQLIITREFEAPLPKVWSAWTEADWLDQWWAPKPWKANTVKMDFRNGGRWLYYMEGPDGSRHYALADYSNIVPQKSYNALDAFCDEKGNIMTEQPRSDWKCTFSDTTDGTMVMIEVSFTELSDMQKMIEMGFNEGFTMAHGNLDELLAR